MNRQNSATHTMKKKNATFGHLVSHSMREKEKHRWNWWADNNLFTATDATTGWANTWIMCRCHRRFCYLIFILSGIFHLFFINSVKSRRFFFFDMFTIGPLNWSNFQSNKMKEIVWYFSECIAFNMRLSQILKDKWCIEMTHDILIYPSSDTRLNSEFHFYYSYSN